MDSNAFGKLVRIYRQQRGWKQAELADRWGFTREKVEVLQVRAQGYTMLQQSEKALAIYKQTDKLRLFRPLRDQASYSIIKAQAHCHAGDIRMGIRYAQAGMKMAESFHSPRYVIRLQQMSDRLQNTPQGKEHAMIALREEIQHSLQRFKD